jgi:hypothetical protein
MVRRPLMVPPRGISRAKRYRSATETGSIPTDDDLLQRPAGLYGSAMPAWGRFSDGDIRAVVQYQDAVTPIRREQPHLSLPRRLPPARKRQSRRRRLRKLQCGKCPATAGAAGATTSFEGGGATPARGRPEQPWTFHGVRHPPTSSCVSARNFRNAHALPGRRPRRCGTSRTTSAR